MNRLKIGAHLSISGGYLAMGKTALAIDANTFQFFTRNPRGSAFKQPKTEDIAALVELMDSHGFAPPLAHAPYTFNPCAADESIREYTAETMIKDLEILRAIPSVFYNFHPGCHVGAGAEAGIAKTADTLRRILPHATHVRVLIETMSGKGTEIGRTFEEIRQMIEQAGNHPNLGVCLDTCHISDGGYDIINDLDRVIEEFDRIIGLDRLCAIHLNDSKNPTGAHKDRHEKIGFGCLGEETIFAVVDHPSLRHLPFYLETPNDLDGYADEIRRIRAHADAPNDAPQ